MNKSKVTAVLKGIAIWVPSVVLGLLFVMQGLMKLSGLPAWIERFETWGYPDRFYLVVGLVELLGGILIVVPRLAAYAGSSLGVVMLGAAVTHFMNGETSNAAFTFGLMAVLLAIAYARSPRGRMWRVAGSAGGT